jgi:Mn2+/Fe2+ NRAMP family transporter
MSSAAVGADMAALVDLNAIVAAPMMVLIMRLASSRRIMGKFTIGRTWILLGWLGTGVMAIASIAFLLSLVVGVD